MNGTSVKIYCVEIEAVSCLQKTDDMFVHKIKWHYWFHYYCDQSIWDLSFETTFISDLFIWDPVLLSSAHLRPHSFETQVIWDHIHLGPHSFEDHIHLRTTFIW